MTEQLTDFQKALGFVLPAEGGFSNVPGDNGGATMEGITQNEYDIWRKQQGRLTQSVQNISVAERNTIYYNNYWIVGHCEGMPWPLSGFSFNINVNAGLGRGVEVLNGVFGMPQNGMNWTPELSVAIHNTQHPANLALAEVNDMDSFYRYLASHYAHDEPFLQGWLNRDAAARKYFDLQS